MGYSLYIVAIFGYFQIALIFGKIAAFSSHFLHRETFNVFLEMFLACFRQFYF